MGTDESNGGANKLGAVLMEDSRMVLEEHVIYKGIAESEEQRPADESRPSSTLTRIFFLIWNSKELQRLRSKILYSPVFDTTEAGYGVFFNKAQGTESA
jgi:hypothetical protein